MVSFDTRVRKAIGRATETKTYVTNAFFTSQPWHWLSHQDLLKNINQGTQANQRIGNEIYVTRIRMAIRINNTNDSTPSVTRFLLMHDKNEDETQTARFWEADQSSAPFEKNFSAADPSNSEYLGYNINTNRYVKYQEWMIACGQYQGERLTPGPGVERKYEFPMVGGLYHQCKYVDIPINKKITFNGTAPTTDPDIKLFFYSEKLLPNTLGNSEFPPELSLQWWVYFKDA